MKNSNYYYYYRDRDGNIRRRSAASGGTPPRSASYPRNNTHSTRSTAKTREARRRQQYRQALLIRAVCVAFVLSVLVGLGAFISGRVVRHIYPRDYSELVEYNCELFGVDETLAYAVIRTESGFDPDARSDVGAMGLMQITPETFEWLQTKLPDPNGTLPAETLYEPEVNIRYGVYFLSRLHSEFGSDTLTAAAYHAGRGRVSGWLDDGVLSASSEYADIPSGTTGHYVHKVEKARSVYFRLYYK